MWVPKLVISSNNKDFMSQNHQIWPDFGIFGHCWLIWCPVGGLAGDCGTGCISQDTYLLYMICVCFSVCSSRTRTWITTSRSRSQAMLSPPQSRREATKGLKPTLPSGVSFIHLIALSCHSFPHILSSCPPCTFPPCS